MSSRSARPVKNEKEFFGKMKDSIEEILTGPQGDQVSGEKASNKTSKDTTVKNSGVAKKPKAVAKKSTIKRKAKNATPEAKTLQGRAEKQVIAAKAKAVTNANIDPVIASKEKS